MDDKAPSFDEVAYLAANPDVAEAVLAGVIGSGAEFHARHGISQRRSLAPGVRPLPLRAPFPDDIPVTRRDKILAGLDLWALRGLEIGALDSPLVRRQEGNIFYVDYTDTKTLMEKHRGDPLVTSGNLVSVDAIWGENSLQKCIGGDAKVDYVVASHVIEHVPDLITWIAEIKSILTPSGSLRLAIPDRRYTFDYLRVETRLHDVADAYLAQARAPQPRLVMDYFNQVRVVDCAAAWDGTLDVDNLKPYHAKSTGLDLARDALATGAYHDTHCWVFTPASFAALCMDMAELDMLGMACANYFTTQRNEAEFIVHMAQSRDKAAIIASWQAMKQSLSGG